MFGLDANPNPNPDPEPNVQVGSNAFPLGRGLSQAKMCTETGKIERVVDIAEAPWRYP